MKNQKIFKLEKDLPSCPKGRIFKETIDGSFLHFMTDPEYIEEKLKPYKFTKDEINGNKQWFTQLKAN